MKKAFVISLLSAFFCLSMASCFDSKDFDFDKLSTSNIKPTLNIPLFKDSLYLKDGDKIKYINGTANYYFSVPEIALPGLNTLLTLPSASINLPSGSVPNPGGGGTITIPLPLSPVSVPMPNGEKVELITVDNMQLTIRSSCNFPATFAVAIPKFTKKGETTAGATYTSTVAANGTSTISLSGTLTLVANSFDIQVTLSTTSSQNPVTYGGSISFTASSSALQSAYGYFGQSTYSATELVEIEAFDQLTGKCNVEAAYLNVTAINYTGIPLQLSLTQVKAGTVTVPENAGDVVGSMLVEAASSASIGMGKKSDGHIGGPELSPIINGIISGGITSASFTFFSKSNPAGETSQKNFFTASTNTIKASGEVVIPMNLAIDDLTVIDTMDIEFPTYTFYKLGAKVYALNNMPVGVTLQAVLLDANGKVMYKTSAAIRDTLFLFPTPVTIESAVVDPDTGLVVEATESNKDLIDLDKSVIDRLKDAASLQVKLRAKSPGSAEGKIVRITNKNYVKVRVGIEAQVKYDDIKDEL